MQGFYFVGVRGLTLLIHCGGAQSKSLIRYAYFGRFRRLKHRRVLLCFIQQKSPALIVQGFYFVGVRGFEPPTSSSRTTRANRAALHPVKK